MVNRNRPLVVGQRVGRRATEPPQRAVKRHHHRRHRATHSGSTTRKRDHANHVQKSTVERPATLGPSP
jgi:hypothetical protein